MEIRILLAFVITMSVAYIVSCYTNKAFSARFLQ